MIKQRLTIAVLAAILTHQLSSVFAVLPADYQSRKAAEKQRLLWDEINVNPYTDTTLPNGPHTPAQLSVLVQYLYYLPAFNHESDEMPAGRLKLFHPYGSCAKATLKIFPKSIYTGVFKAGTSSPLIIRSSIANWDQSVLKPGLGIKVLVDHEPSVNFHTIFSLDGQEGNNFLENIVSNQFVQGPPAPPLLVLIRAMEMAMMLFPGGIEGRPEGVDNLGLVEQCSVESNGNQVADADIVAPWKVEFVPNKAFGVPADSTDDFRVQLGRIPANSVLYTVVLHRTKEDFENGVEGSLVGEVIINTQLIASNYCDERLFMRHARKRWHA